MRSAACTNAVAAEPTALPPLVGLAEVYGLTGQPEYQRDVLDRLVAVAHGTDAKLSYRYAREVAKVCQREIIAGCRRTHGGVVAEGRDITTVVAPDADVRVLLTASPAARLARRARDDHGEATAAAIQATHDLVVGRDAADSTVVDFTAPAEGVTLVDTSDLGFEDSVAAVLAVVAASTSNRPW